jgi:hypothetical protein
MFEFLALVFSKLLSKGTKLGRLIVYALLVSAGIIFFVLITGYPDLNIARDKYETLVNINAIARDSSLPAPVRAGAQRDLVAISNVKTYSEYVRAFSERIVTASSTIDNWPKFIVWSNYPASFGSVAILPLVIWNRRLTRREKFKDFRNGIRDLSFTILLGTAVSFAAYVIVLPSRVSPYKFAFWFCTILYVAAFAFVGVSAYHHAAKKRKKSDPHNRTS